MVGAGCERCERREGVVTVEVQAWCAASVVWRVMREEKRRREEVIQLREEGKVRRREKRKERTERRRVGCHPSNTTKRERARESERDRNPPRLQ